VFVLVFVVEFEVGYNLFMHKTQLQKLLFIVFFSFFGGSHTQNSTSTSKTNTLRPYVEYFTVKKFPSFSVFNFRKKKSLFMFVFYKIFYRLIKKYFTINF